MALESIALIPSGYKATKVYSQLPVNGNGDFTFDRGTSTDQTRVNKNGLIESVDQDVPRLDYLDGGCPSLLLEPATTNLYTYSEDFTNSSWFKDNSTISANSILSPDGSVNADTLVEDGANAIHSVRQLLAVTSGNDYTISFFVKATANPRDLFIQCSDAGIKVYFDTTNWVVGAEVLGTGKVESYGNDWYRISASGTAVATGSDNVRIGLSDGFASGDETYTGNSANGMYIFGAQFEQQSYATSYVRSLAGVSGVRNAETASATGLSSYINSNEGVLYAEIRALADDGNFKPITISDNSYFGTNIYIGYTSTSNEIQLLTRISGSIDINQTYTILNSIDTIKIALRYKQNDYALYINGLLIDKFLSADAPSVSLTALRFDRGDGTLPFYGRVKKLSVYDQALSDSELETLTGFSSFAEMSSYLSYS